MTAPQPPSVVPEQIQQHEAAAAALELGIGFIGVRKTGSVLAGEKEELRAAADWRGVEDVLRLQRHVVAPGDRVLVVDDWAE